MINRKVFEEAVMKVKILLEMVISTQFIGIGI